MAERMSDNTVRSRLRATLNENVVDAARLNADYATVLGATAAGLRMLPGDEHFLGLRRAIGDETTAPSPNQSPFASTH